jgi:hypothetical protein
VKYLLISTEDAETILRNLTVSDPDSERIAARLREDTGGDFEEIAEKLKGYGACWACVVEGQQRDCIHIPVNALGRRLVRLVARAQPWAALQAEINAMMTGRDMLTLHLAGEPGNHFWGWSANGPSGGPADRVSIAIGPCRGATVADLIEATREAITKAAEAEKGKA